MSNFLLGNLGECERSLLEERVFANDELFAELLAAEDRLNADYLEGRLTEEEIEQFVTYYLCTEERRRNFEILKAIAGSDAESEQLNVMQEPKVENSRGRFLSHSLRGWRLALATGALAVFAFAFWLARPAARPERSAVLPESNNRAAPTESQFPSPAEAPQNAAANSMLPASNAKNSSQNTNRPKKPAAANPTLATLLLTPGSTRGGAGNRSKLKLAASVRTVVLKLSFRGGAHVLFDVVIQTPEGKTVWKRSGIRAAKPVRSLTLTLPSSTFSPDDHILTLSSLDAEGRRQKLEEYFFSVQDP